MKEMLSASKKLTFISMLLAGSVLVSCKKDKDTMVKPAEPSPITKTYFLDRPVTIAATGSGNYEYGFKFGVTQKGKVTKLACRMPDAGNYRVTLWDASVTPQVVIGTATITQAAGALTFQPITPVSLETGKDYFVSVWSSGKWYEIKPAGGGSFPYPISVGSITIKGYQWISSAAAPQKFPTSPDNTYIAGLADLEFQPD